MKQRAPPAAAPKTEFRRGGKRDHCSAPATIFVGGCALSPRLFDPPVFPTVYPCTLILKRPPFSTPNQKKNTQNRAPLWRERERACLPCMIARKTRCPRGAPAPPLSFALPPRPPFPLCLSLHPLAPLKSYLANCPRIRGGKGGGGVCALSRSAARSSPSPPPIFVKCRFCASIYIHTYLKHILRCVRTVGGVLYTTHQKRQTRVALDSLKPSVSLPCVVSSSLL
jgi:hypothetical protein